MIVVKWILFLVCVFVLVCVGLAMAALVAVPKSDVERFWEDEEQTRTMKEYRAKKKRKEH